MGKDRSDPENCILNLAKDHKVFEGSAYVKVNYGNVLKVKYKVFFRFT